MRTFRYGNGGKEQGTPTPPSWIVNDPRFQNIHFIGSNYENKMNRASGYGGADFRYDLKGVKFYGFDDDGFTFIDENGNAFEAERTTDQGSMIDYIKGMGAKYSEEYNDIVRQATEAKQAEPQGPVGTIIHKSGLVTGSGDPRGQIIDHRPGREDMRPGQLRRGLRQIMRQDERADRRMMREANRAPLDQLEGGPQREFKHGGVMNFTSPKGLRNMFKRSQQ